jgi:hypothetical protein
MVRAGARVGVRVGRGGTRGATRARGGGDAAGRSKMSPDGWAPSGGERWREERGGTAAGWALVGRNGHATRVSELSFFPFFLFSN